MRSLLFFLCSICLLNGFGQTVEETYPKTLWCANDTFGLRFSNYPETFRYAMSVKNGSPGTDATLGLYAMIYYGKDSIRLNYHNHVPYAHIFFVNLESPKGKATLRIHFNDLSCYFSKTYIDQHKGTASFDIPEAYELANIIWALSPTGQPASDLDKGGTYYKEMLQHFKPYQKHAIFKRLDFADSLYFEKYYEFRENSFAFNFSSVWADSTRLSYNGPYYYVYGDELADSSLFGKLKPLVEDFARVSKFRHFYKQHSAFYAKEIVREKELMPLKTMWSWLEAEFPKSKHDSYRVVFSPLTGGSHSTQIYRAPDFKEIVMFVCGPGRVDEDKQLSEKQKEGLLSGVVFTEIDHNHVNPETRRYKAQVDSIFSKRNYWVNSNTNNEGYSSSSSVFNEYMTWAVFCVYIGERYDAATADFIIKKREALMVERRHFIRFREFDAELIHLRNEHKDLKMAELYPFILNWCKARL